MFVCLLLSVVCRDRAREAGVGMATGRIKTGSWMTRPRPGGRGNLPRPEFTKTNLYSSIKMKPKSQKFN